MISSQFPTSTDSASFGPKKGGGVIRSLTTAQENLLKSVPASQKSLFIGVFSGKRGRTDAMRAKCLDCVGFARNEVRECRVTACPLWRIRPFQKSTAERR
jgi:hypothetical protein